MLDQLDKYSRYNKNSKLPTFYANRDKLFLFNILYNPFLLQGRFTMETNHEKNTGRSILTYTPVSEIDYGTLSCRATNLVGQQVAPCMYTLLPATIPDPPSNCTVYNLTHDSLDLLCTTGTFFVYYLVITKCLFGCDSCKKIKMIDFHITLLRS